MDFENAIDICSCSVRTSDTESASIIKALISACDPDRSHRCVTFEEEVRLDLFEYADDARRNRTWTTVSILLGATTSIFPIKKKLQRCYCC